MHTHAFIVIPIFNPLNVNSLEWKAHHALCYLFYQGLIDRVVLMAALHPRGNERLETLLSHWESYVLQVRRYTYSIPMFYKEQLLALGVQWIVRHVPRSICFAVVWMDCDILFLHADWMKRVEMTLRDWNNVPIIQAYHTSYELEESKLCIQSFDHKTKTSNTSATRTMGSAASHGHVHLSPRINPGYVWAARLDFLEQLPFFGFHPGFILGGYDAALVHMLGIELEFDSLDTIMHQHAFSTVGHAITEYFRTHPNIHSTGINRRQYCSYVKNIIKVVYHGSLQNRQYKSRYEIVRQHAYNPVTDITYDTFLSNDELVQFSAYAHKNKPQLMTDIKQYFSQRQESLPLVSTSHIYNWKCRYDTYTCDTAQTFRQLPNYVRCIGSWPMTTSWTDILLSSLMITGIVLLLLVVGILAYSSVVKHLSGTPFARTANKQEKQDR